MSEIVTPGFVTRELEFNPATVSVDAIQRAAYRLSDRLAIDLRVGEPVVCVIHIADGEDPELLLFEFRNEVLDQVLREKIRTETEAARNLILSLAFSRTGVLPHA